MQPTAPTTLGKYRLIRRLAVGGMAEVYLAKVAGPGGFEKTLVLKRVLPHLTADEDFIAMFQSEAKLAARLSHPNVVSIFDFGQEGDDWFLVMEFIDGQSLQAILRHANQRGQPVPFPIAARVVSLVCEGLSYAHDFKDPETGVPLDLVHRDISADNILLGKSGEVKVVDFGIAKSALQSHRTQAGLVKGKVMYMSPEQLRGQRLDRRTDVFSLGHVLYELIAGCKPFDSNAEARIIQMTLLEAYPPVTKFRRDAPAELQRILGLALAKDRGARYRDCRQLQADLDRFLLGQGGVGPQQLAQWAVDLSDPFAQLPALEPADPHPTLPPHLLGAIPQPPAPQASTESANRPTLPHLHDLETRPQQGEGAMLGPVPISLEPTGTEATVVRRSPGAVGTVPQPPREALVRETVVAAGPAAPSGQARGPLPPPAAAHTWPRRLRVVGWLVTPPLAIAIALLAHGVLKERGFSDDHPHPGKLLRAGAFNVHAIDELGQGRAVIFIHGDKGSSLDFATVQRLLSPRFRTLAVDRPGHGWTDRPRDEMTPLDQARLLHDALKQLALTRPVLVGVGLASTVVSAWALEYPEELGALVYLCPTASGRQLRGLQASLAGPLGKLVAYGVGPFLPEAPNAGRLRLDRPTTLLAGAWDQQTFAAELPRLASRYPEFNLPAEALSSAGEPLLERSIPGIHSQPLGSPCLSLLDDRPEEVARAVTRATDRAR